MDQGNKTRVKLFTALTTTHGAVKVQTIMGLLDYFRDRSIDKDVFLYMDPYIVLGRNTAAADFLKRDHTHLLFIDADIMFLWQHIERLLSHDVDLVGGLYAKKQEGKLNWVCNALPERPPEDERGLLSLRHIGTGFLLIKRCVLEKMVKAMGESISYLEDETDRPLWDFFDMPRVDGRKLSEDWHFCNVARSLGFTVYGDTRCLLRHVGDAVYPLKTQVEESNQYKLEKVNIG